MSYYNPALAQFKSKANEIMEGLDKDTQKENEQKQRVSVSPPDDTSNVGEQS